MFALFVATVLGCDPDACGPPTGGTEACPVDECAAECWSPALAISCCIDAHGRGIGPKEQAQVDQSTGRLEEPPETSQFLSAEAALCAAQVHGLPSGALGCEVFLTDLGTSWVWEAWNGTQSCEENGTWIADVVMVDATTGGFYSFGAVMADCDL